MRVFQGVACVLCTIAAVLPPFNTGSRINVVLAVVNGLMCICAKGRS